MHHRRRDFFVPSAKSAVRSEKAAIPCALCVAACKASVPCDLANTPTARAPKCPRDEYRLEEEANKRIWLTDSNRSRQFSERRRGHVVCALCFLHRRQCAFVFAEVQEIVSRETMRRRDASDCARSAQRQTWAWCSATPRLRFDCARTTKGNSAQSKENGEEG